MTDDKSIFKYADENDTTEEAEVVAEIPEGVDDLPKYTPPKIDRKNLDFDKGGEK